MHAMHVQVAIIGGGPAGAVCAAALAARHVDVCVIEACQFPRTKVCGEYLAPAASRLLEAYLNERILRRAGARQIDRLELYAQGQKVADWAFPGVPGRSWSLSRASLDALLLSRASSAGAQLCQPVAVRRVVYRENDVELNLDNGRALRADFVVHADGSGRHDPAGPVPVRRGVVASKCHVQPSEPIGSTLQLHGLGSRGGRGYCGVVGVEGAQVTLAMVVDARLMKQLKRDPDHLFDRLYPLSMTRSSEWYRCAVACSDYVDPGHARSFRIGNAAGAVEPIGGEGIGMAMWSGDRLGRMLDPHDPGRTQRAMRRAYRARLALRRPVCLALAWSLSHPSLLRALCPILDRQPGLVLRPLYHLSGK